MPFPALLFAIMLGDHTHGRARLHPRSQAGFGPVALTDVSKVGRRRQDSAARCGCSQSRILSMKGWSSAGSNRRDVVQSYTEKGGSRRFTSDSD